MCFPDDCLSVCTHQQSCAGINSFLHGARTVNPDFKLKVIRISTELRYTRQFNDAVVSLSQLNQADVLVGIHF